MNIVLCLGKGIWNLRERQRETEREGVKKREEGSSNLFIDTK
jgi:hypothetical protein